MSLLNLIENIISGKLTESNNNFKTTLSEKISQKLDEKRKGRYDKDLDANKNGKLDSDDFKILRAKKKSKECHSDCNEELDESSNPEDMITDPKDRQSYLGHKKMEQNHINQYRKTTSPIKKGHHQDMIQQHSDAAGEILDKYRKESVELDEAGDKPLEKWSGDTRTAKELKTQIRNLDNDTLKKWSGDSSNKFGKSTVSRMQDKLVKSEIRKRQTESVELDEVLKNADAGEYVKDFQQSDAPQFAGKSKEKRRKMAIAAFYSAKKK